MKKNILLLFALIGFGTAVMAQDLIITKDKAKIYATVTEVNENDIRYKLFDNPSGPVYFLKKSEIASILYENGYVDVFNINTSVPPQFGSYYPYYQYTQYDFKNAKGLRNAGIALFSTGMAFTFPMGLSLLLAPTYKRYDDYWGSYRYRDYDDNQQAAGVAFLCMGPPITIVGIIMWSVGQYRMDMIRRFNPNGFSLFENQKVQLNLAVGSNSMGLKLNF